MQEVEDEVSILAAPVVDEGVGQSLDGEFVGHPAKGDDEDRVPLRERYKRSRSPMPVVAKDSSSPGVAGGASGAPRPSQDGREKLKIGLTLRPTAASARLVL